jgi:hypothetical protein
VESPQIDARTVLRRAGRAVHGALPEETVLLDTEEDVAVRLNATGAWLWERLAEPEDVQTLAHGLAERFEIDAARALDDTAAFAREMIRRGLLESEAA